MRQPGGSENRTAGQQLAAYTTITVSSINVMNRLHASPIKSRWYAVRYTDEVY